MEHVIGSDEIELRIRFVSKCLYLQNLYPDIKSSDRCCSVVKHLCSAMVGMSLTLSVLILGVITSGGCKSLPRRQGLKRDSYYYWILNIELINLITGLNQYRWNKRVIVTYSDSEHPELLQLQSEISQRSCEYGNRNLVHEHVVTSDADGDFRLDLIGYDGFTKYTGHRGELQTLFDIIDRMPMRRSEIASDRACS